MTDDRNRDLADLMALIRSGVAEEEADAFLELVKSGQKITAIKILRERIGSLKEAKELNERIEAMLLELRLIEPRKQAGCLGVVLFVALLGGVLGATLLV